MEREVGGGIGMGNTCKPMAVSFQCMTKFTTNKKKKKKFPQSVVIHTVKGLSRVNETEIDFLFVCLFVFWNSLPFSMIRGMLVT